MLGPRFPVMGEPPDSSRPVRAPHPTPNAQRVQIDDAMGFLPWSLAAQLRLVLFGQGNPGTEGDDLVGRG